MDSLTQIVLGAAVGEATLGKKVGNRAPLWGAILGTVPDLDVVSGIFQSEIAYLASHRGVTHSIAFCVLAAPVFGALINKLYRNNWGSLKEWSKLAFWVLLTHALLDCCTTWGTQLFYPLSDYRVAWNNIFVIDPLYTLPFLLFLVLAIVRKRESPWRRFWNAMGLSISSLYLIFTLANKLTVTDVFQANLHRQGHSVSALETYPTPLNNLLWYCVAEEPSVYSIGYYSLLSKRPVVRFVEIPKSHFLLEGHQEDPAVETLKWISKGQYALEITPDQQLLWHDLRFGLFGAWRPGQPVGKKVFTFNLIEKEGRFVDVKRLPPDFSKLSQEEWQQFWAMILARPLPAKK